MPLKLRDKKSDSYDGRIYALDPSEEKMRGFNWKDHPLAIAATAVVLTAGFFASVVIPLSTEYLRGKVDALTENVRKHEKIEQELQEKEKQLADAYALIGALTAVRPFALGSKYPSGAERVMLGALEEKVVEIFPDGSWDKYHKGEYYKVSFNNKSFQSAVYNFDQGAEGRFVSSIVFYFSNPLESVREVVIQHFDNLFGEGVSYHGALAWMPDEKEWFIVYESSFLIVPAGSVRPEFGKIK